jgi:quinoprotein dehydrogenase-associated probable ABC transporter substrate-binding protein
MVRIGLALLCVSLVVCPALIAGQTPAPSRGAQPPAAQRGQAAQFRVCADPENMPFSSRALEGFENKLAALLAADFGTTPSYIWWGQRQGFIRNTMNATLAEGRCEVVMGVPAGYDLVRTTKPYYRSTYVFVSLRSRRLAIRSLDAPALKTLKIGVHLIGNDYENPPPVHELGKRHIVDNVVGFSTFYSAENPPSAIIEAVTKGTIDVAIVWGPVAGYFAARQRVPLEIVPIPSGKGDLPFEFDIAMGVRKGNDALHARLEQLLERRRPEIARLLAEYSVPLVERKVTRKP